MTENRKQHLEIVAAQLTAAYYSEHTAASRDYRDLLDTFTYILDALVEKDGLPAGHSPLTASDTLANPQRLIPEISANNSRSLCLPQAN